MKYTVVFSKEALKDLKKLDKHTAALNPRAHGKGLTANLNGKWRYRVGDYRLLADIQDDKVVIMMLRVGHRSEIYKE